MQAKRILVIEESEVVRETLALILGREFVVAKKPFGKGVFPFTETDRDVDLLILGVTPAIGKEPSNLLRFADKAPFAVLFLVDSKSAARAIDDRSISAAVRMSGFMAAFYIAAPADWHRKNTK